MYKKQKMYSKAVELWKTAAQNGDIEATIELAKYYEHHLKEYRAAADIVEQAIELAVVITNPLLQRIKLSEFDHRLMRLKRLIGNQQNG
jgi:hypothetical protein